MANAIEIRELSKVYKLYDQPVDRLKEAIHPLKKQYYREYYAIESINLDIQQGDTIGIVGRNGAGKSTLLKIISGVLTPSSGTVAVNGKISALLELGAGFNPEYTGMENIYLNGTMIGLSRQEIDTRVQEIIRFADIGDFIYQPVKVYSSGMFVRLAFAVAISIEPDILIVDEALSVGDAFFQAKSMTKMKSLFEKGSTVIFVTHDTSTVKSLCNTAVYLDQGKIIDIGPAKNVVDRYERDIRETLNSNLSVNRNSYTQPELSGENREKSLLFRENPDFGYRVANSRQGSGQARITDLELLDESGNAISVADFNQLVTVRLYIRFYEFCHVGVGYHIRDNKNQQIIGSNTVFEGMGEISGQAGEGIVVDFLTRLPLVEGYYNIATVLSTATIDNKTVIFEDYTQDGCIFQMNEHSVCKIWNKVYVDNVVNIHRMSLLE